MKRSRKRKSGNGKWAAVWIGLIAIMLVLAYIIAAGITGTWNPGKWKKDKSGGATAESANAGQMTLSDGVQSEEITLNCPSNAKAGETVSFTVTAAIKRNRPKVKSAKVCYQPSLNEVDIKKFI